MKGSPARRSVWFDGVEERRYPSLQGSRRVDVCIVGGGLTGLTLAHLLKKAGRSVAVLEAWELGYGVTGGTSAHLTAMVDHPLPDLESSFGPSNGHRVFETGMGAIALLESICQELAIDGFARIPGVLYAEDEAQAERFQPQLDAAHRMGIPAEELDPATLPVPARRALRLENQGRIHALRYLQGVAAAVDGGNGAVFEHTRAIRIDSGNPCVVQTADGEITSDYVVLATHTPVGVYLSVQARVRPYRSYCIGARIEGDFPDMLLWDLHDPYHYIRREGDVLIVGGQDHRTGHGERLVDNFAALEEWTRARFAVGEITHRWSAQVFEPADGLPYIGRAPGSQSVFITGGYSGTGWTFGAAAAMIIAEQVQGREHPWASLYDPKRFGPIESVPEVLKDNLHVGYRFVADRVRSADGDLEDLAPGQGRLVSMNGRKVAAYRDENGLVTLMSPVCRHTGGIVQWNDAEKSWDCPLHGGRYAPCGDVLDGPPMCGLERLGEEVAGGQEALNAPLAEDPEPVG